MVVKFCDLLGSIGSIKGLVNSLKVCDQSV